MKNILYKTNQTFSLSKLNPCLNEHGQEIPFHYIDPSFKQNYCGPVLLKDLYFHNMYNKFFNNNNNIKIKNKKNSKTKEFIFNPNKFQENNVNIYNNILRNIDKKYYDNNPFVEKYGIFNFGFAKKLQERKLLISNNNFNVNNVNNNNKHKIKIIKNKKMKIIPKKKIDNYYSYQLPSVYDNNKNKTNDKKIMVNKSTNITNKNTENNSKIETPNYLITDENLIKSKNKKFDTSTIKKIELSLNF